MKTQAPARGSQARSEEGLAGKDQRFQTILSSEVGLNFLSSTMDGGFGPSQKMLKARSRRTLTEQSGSRRKHSGQGAVLEEVAWRGARVVDLLIVS